MRVLHGDYTSRFEELLVTSEEITIHCSNLQKFMIELYECVERLTPCFRYIVKFTVGNFLVLVLSERIRSKIENCLLRYIEYCLLRYIENCLLH